MISDPYKGISEEVVLVLESLISADDSYHQGHKARMAKTIQLIVDAKPSGSLLEIGTSHLLPLALELLLPDLTVFVTDFDLDKETIGDITISLNGFSKIVHCARVNIEEEPLPFLDGGFDYVVCTEVLEHMEVDPMYMLSELNRVTKEGGILILTTPNAVSSWAVTKILMGIEPYFYMQYRHNRSLYRHNYEYSVHSLVKVLQAAGYDGTVWTENSFEDPSTRDIQKLESAGYKLKNLGDNIFCVAKRVSGVVERHPKVIYAD